MSRGRFSWFKKLFGFEESASAVRDNFVLAGDTLTSTVNQRTFAIGKFSTLTLHELRSKALELLAVSDLDQLQGFEYEHVAIPGVMQIHHSHPKALFQAASQFNCLEFTSSKTIPEKGVEIYAMDNTQGPACALACAAGTVFRNYFVRVPGSPAEVCGQTAQHQLNNLDNLEELLDNEVHQFWYLENGYTFSKDSRNLDRLKQVLASHTNIDELRDAIKVGFQQDVGVTFKDSVMEEVHEDTPIAVSQVYGSALSCAYSGIHNSHWEPLAQLVLQANYEATLWAGIINMLSHDADQHSREVYLTFLGGGVFGNDMRWITAAIARALAIVAKTNVGIKVKICHFRNIDQNIQNEINFQFSEELSKSP